MMSSFLSKWRWRHTEGWLPWETSILQAVARRIDDPGFRAAFESQVMDVFEVRRTRQHTGCYSWPAFYDRNLFVETDPQLLATLTARVASANVTVAIQIGAGMISRITVAGDHVPTPGRLCLHDIAVLQIALPTPRDAPIATGWVKELCERGILALGEKPPGLDVLRKYQVKFPCLPVDYFDFCSQSDGGVILPNSEKHSIFGLRDLGPARTPRGKAFIPLVDMRELGGLGCFVAHDPQPVMDFSEPEGSLFAETFGGAIERLGQIEHTDRT